MEIILNTEPISDTANKNVGIRIRFAGTKSVETYHLTPNEGSRFYTEWSEYLKGSNMIGGTYTIEESDRSVVISLNFSLIAYIENGKIY